MITTYETEKEIIVKRLLKYFAETPEDALYIQNSINDAYQLGRMLGSQTGIRWEDEE